MKLIEKEFEVANNNKLANPALADAPWFGDFDVAFVSSANASCWINAQWSFGCKYFEVVILIALDDFEQN